MAYYPMTYYGNPYQPQMQPQMQTQPQIQNGGFVSVANIDVARNWPIAPGNSVTFKDENSPYVYTKTMGFSQLDRPIFEVFRLVKEEDAVTAQRATTSNGAASGEYALKRDLDALYDVVDTLKGEIVEFRDRLNGDSGRDSGNAKKETEVG